MKLHPERYSAWLAWAEVREKTIPVGEVPLFRAHVYGVIWALILPLTTLPTKGKGIALWLAIGKWAKRNEDPLAQARQRIEAMEARWGRVDGGESVSGS